MTMEERGQYITLICYQHQKGHISLETIRLLVGNVSVKVLNHFKIDENGLYYNERMDKEKEAKFLGLTQRLAGLASLWKLSCTKDPQAAKIAYDAMHK